MILELGCGTNPTPGADIYHRGPEDHDLDVIPWPWADGSFTAVWAYDVFEHLRIDVADWMHECWRILQPGGALRITVPAWDGENSWVDPTHRRPFNLRTFNYFDPATEEGQLYGLHYWPAGPWWEVMSAGKEFMHNLRFYLRKRDG